MGMAGLRELARLRHTSPAGEAPHIVVLARDTKANRRKLAPFIADGVEVVWGDLMNPDDVARGVERADVVLHVGGMVSPQADWHPDLTYRVNTTAMRHIIDAALRRQATGEEVKVVYIGSVSQYGNRPEGAHWGRTGDPVAVATYDKYALSKCVAERMLAESGLRRWASLRQTGIMYPRILMNGSDPIAFHVPLRGCLEWVSDTDSGRLLRAVASPSVPDSFWCRYYNIGGGESYRMSNYDFVQLTLRAVGCPPAEKVFGRNWFATRNFHGMWYLDSDLLDALLHFRSGETMPDFVAGIIRQLPWYFRLAPLAPAWAIRAAMKRVAMKRVLGPLRWVADDDADRLFAAFGGRDAWKAIPGWRKGEDWSLPREAQPLDHGYDETRPLASLTLAALDRAARYRGGRCRPAIAPAPEAAAAAPATAAAAAPGSAVAEAHAPAAPAAAEDAAATRSIDPDTPIEWECAEGHRFRLRPRTVLLGGHWCPECLAAMSADPHALYRQATSNPFLAQIVK